MKPTYSVDLIRLKSLLVLNQINIVTLAEKVGVTKSTMYAVFSGGRPSYSVMCGIADALKLSAEEAGQIFLQATYVKRNT